MTFGSMQKAEGSFEWLSWVLRITGMLDLEKDGDWWKRYLITAINIGLQVCLLLASLGRIFEDGVTFSEQIDAALIFVANFHLFTKVVALPFRRHIVLDLFSNIKVILDESSSDPKFSKMIKRNIYLAKLFFLGVVGNFLLMHVAANISSIIKYSNNIYALPFQFYVPFDGHRHFYLACAYSFAISVVPIANLGMTMTLLVALVLNLSTCMIFLTSRLARLGAGHNSQEEEDKAVQRAILLHQNILRIVANLNELLSDLLYIEFLLSSLQICISGYQLIIARGQADPRTPVFMFIFLLTIVVPVFFNLCGNQIKQESERVFEAAYDNTWYALSNSNKQSLLVVIGAAGRTLSFSYRNLISFDMEQYSLMLKTAYSLVAMLQTMDPKKFS